MAHVAGALQHQDSQLNVPTIVSQIMIQFQGLLVHILSCTSEPRPC